jgi:hypothetical protein
MKRHRVRTIRQSVLVVPEQPDAKTSSRRSSADFNKRFYRFFRMGLCAGLIGRGTGGEYTGGE